jgi:hypothetical protein
VPSHLQVRAAPAVRLHERAATDLVVARGEYATSGFRNRDLRQRLYPNSLPDDRRLSAKVSRQLRLLRAHALIKKVPKTHRYQVSDRGPLLAAALHATREASITQLLRDAA